MIIRTAVKNDASVIVDFNIRLARETEALELDPETVSQGVAALIKDSSKGIYFVAEATRMESPRSKVQGPKSEELAGKQVVGQLMITYEWSDWRNGTIWWIQSVYVKEKFRGCGVFQALFEYVEKLACETQDVCALRLYMDKHNESARRAYGKMGMIESAYVVFEKGLRGGKRGIEE